MKAIDRVYKYLNTNNIAPTNFEKKIGLSNGYLGTQRKRNANLGEEVMNKIIDNCLDISPDWLLTGRGEMLRDTSQIAQPSHIATDTNCQEKLSKQEAHYTSIIQSKDDIITSKNETISVLKEQITTKDGQLATKDMQIDTILSDSKKNNLIHNIADKLNLSNNK